MRDSADFAARWSSLEWSLVRSRPLSVSVNLALEEVLTSSVALGQRKPTVRFWGWSTACAVLGRFQSVRNEIDEAAARARGVTIARRISGGGTMFIEPEGAITWSVYAPESLVEGMDFIQSYEFFDSWVVGALRQLGIDAWYQPINDITSPYGKIAGAAQARRGGAVLHHTTMAYSMDNSAMLAVLRTGKERISDKGIVSADKKVGPLRLQTDLGREEIVESFIASFRKQFRLDDDDLTPDELSRAQALARDKFETREWIYALP